FGDALAWILIGGDRRYIHPLVEGQRTGAVATGINLKALIAIAEAMWDSNVGVPIIHDMTNILRVGDITFVSLDNKPITVEVKTQIIESSQDNIVNLNITAHSIVNFELYKSIQSRFNRNDSESPQPRPQRKDPRFRRQQERMLNAAILQDTEAGVLFKQ